MIQTTTSTRSLQCVLTRGRGWRTKTQTQTSRVGIGVTECFDPSHGHTTLHKLKRKPSDTMIIITNKTNQLARRSSCVTDRIVLTFVGQHIERVDLERRCLKAFLPYHGKQQVLNLLIIKFTYYKIYMVLQKNIFRGLQGKSPTDVNLKDFYIDLSILTRTAGLHFLELLENLWFQSFSQ